MLHLITDIESVSDESNIAGINTRHDEMDLQLAFKDLDCDLWNRRNQMLKKTTSSMHITLGMHFRARISWLLPGQIGRSERQGSRGAASSLREEIPN